MQAFESEENGNKDIILKHLDHYIHVLRLSPARRADRSVQKHNKGHLLNHRKYHAVIMPEVAASAYLNNENHTSQNTQMTWSFNTPPWTSPTRDDMQH